LLLLNNFLLTTKLFKATNLNCDTTYLIPIDQNRKKGRPKNATSALVIQSGEVIFLKQAAASSSDVKKQSPRSNALMVQKNNLVAKETF
jgi:hypothetical protein